MSDLTPDVLDKLERLAEKVWDELTLDEWDEWNELIHPRWKQLVAAARERDRWRGRAEQYVRDVKAAHEDLLAAARERDRLLEEAERLRVQLAGCGVAAQGGTSVDMVAKPGSYGYSASYQSVLDLRLERDALKRDERERDRLRATLEQSTATNERIHDELETEVVSLEPEVASLRKLHEEDGKRIAELERQNEALAVNAAKLEKRIEDWHEVARDETDEAWLNLIGEHWKDLTGSAWETRDGETVDEGRAANVAALFEHMSEQKERIAELEDAIAFVIKPPSENWDASIRQWRELMGPTLEVLEAVAKKGGAG